MQSVEQGLCKETMPGRIRMRVPRPDVERVLGPPDDVRERLRHREAACQRGFGDAVVVAPERVAAGEVQEVRVDQDVHADVSLRADRGQPVEVRDEVAPGGGIVEVVVVEVVPVGAGLRSPERIR